MVRVIRPCYIYLGNPLERMIFRKYGNYSILGDSIRRKSILNNSDGNRVLRVHDACLNTPGSISRGPPGRHPSFASCRQLCQVVEHRMHVNGPIFATTESILKFYSAKYIVSELSRRMLAFLGDVDVMRGLQIQKVQSIIVFKLHLRNGSTRFVRRPTW